MLILFLRALQLGLAGASVYFALPDGREALVVLIVQGVAILLVWFPNEVDELTLGLWYAGYRIESHTPNWLIMGFGWLFSLAITVLEIDGSK
jgi:hypothetical protein